MKMIEPYLNRIICGDCLEVMREMPDNSIDFIFTDPPYGHNNNNGDLIHRWEAALGRLPNGLDSPSARPIENDGPETNELFRQAIKEWARILKPGCCCCCCCGGGGPDPQFARWSLWLDEVLEFKQMVVWDKGPMGMGWHYRRSYETVLVATKKGAACKWYDTTHKIENIIRPGFRGIKKIIPSKNDHPTAKPIDLASHFIQLHSTPGDIVLDCFAGRGGTIVAASKLGRNFIGIEIIPEEVELAEERIRRETAQLNMFHTAREPHNG